MQNTPKVPKVSDDSTPRPKRKSSKFKLFGAACYCGLGPDCAMYRIMTPDERAVCSEDMRRTAQYQYKNGY
jgi:hypothetical protein